MEFHNIRILAIDAGTTESGYAIMQFYDDSVNLQVNLHSPSQDAGGVLDSRARAKLSEYRRATDYSGPDCLQQSFPDGKPDRSFPPVDDKLNLLAFGKTANAHLMQIVKSERYDQLVYEQFQSFGMAVGESTIEAIIWNGRFIQAAIDSNHPVDLVYRKEEKLCLCNSLRAKDSNIRQALIDRYAKTDFKNGKGTKKEPDVFYGVGKDVWSAIAVGVTWMERKKEEERQQKWGEWVSKNA